MINLNTDVKYSVVKFLKDEENFTFDEISEFFGVSRQRIDQIYRAYDDHKNALTRKEKRAEKKRQLEEEKQRKRNIRSERNRKIMFMRFDQHKTYREISEVFGIRPQFVRSIVFRELAKQNKTEGD